MMKNYIEISKSALINNYNSFASLCSDSFIVPVLKSNAYGHGLDETYNCLKELNLEWIL